MSHARSIRVTDELRRRIETINTGRIHYAIGVCGSLPGVLPHMRDRDMTPITDALEASARLIQTLQRALQPKKKRAAPKSGPSRRTKRRKRRVA